MKQEIEAAIRAAWASPIMNQWNPNKHPTCVATVKRNRPPDTSPGGIILPASALPLLPGPADKPIEYKVAFEIHYATVTGRPAFQITGSCQGVRIVVKQGYLQHAGRMPEEETGAAV
jgi:hypothetical protein